MYSKFKNKTVIITGGSGLIGSAFSTISAKYGANVVIIDIDKKKSDNLVKQIKEKTRNDAVYTELIYWNDINIRITFMILFHT